jgi:proteasome assembly chaperone (PAC2) family protein
MHEAIRVIGEQRGLHDPVLLAAFRGWTDPAGAAVAVLRYLRREWDAQLLAEIDPEYFYDLSVERPQVRIVNGEREIRWPRLRIHVARPPGAERDVLLLFGREPSLRWRTLAEALTEFVGELGGSTSITIGALGGRVPHTRPSPVMLWGAHQELEAAFGIESTFSDYQGPIGFQNALTLHHSAVGWRTAFLFALAPHYLTIGPNPNVTRPLVQALDRALGASTPTARLDEWRGEFERRVRQVLDQNEGTAQAVDYIRQLEAEYDSDPPGAPLADAGGTGDSDLPSVEDVIRDFEQMMRQRREDDASASD